MRALRRPRQRALMTALAALAALAAACATTMPAATPTAPPATVTPAPTPEPTATPTVTASPPPADSPSPAPTPELETLPQGAVVDMARASVSRAIGFWPPAAYGGWDEPTDEGYELVVETSDELIVLDGRSGAVLHTLERPSVAQINAVLVTTDSVWLTDHDAGAVLRLDRETGETLARIKLGTRFGARAVSLVETEQGIWAGSAHTYPESVVLIDPETNTAGRTVEAGAYPGYLGGSFWFGRDERRSSASGIRRVDPRNGDVLATIEPAGADSCYVGGSFPDAVWSFCYTAPPGQTRASRLDVEASVVVATVALGGAGSLIGVTGGYSWFLVDASGDLPSRVVRVDNSTNTIERTFALTATPPPFDMAAVIDQSLWVIDVEAAELRMIPLDDL
jgi:hypothetical protein